MAACFAVMSALSVQGRWGEGDSVGGDAPPRVYFLNLPPRPREPDPGAPPTILEELCVDLVLGSVV